MSITNNAFLSNSLTNTYTSIYASNISLNILYWLHNSINALYFAKKHSKDYRAKLFEIGEKHGISREPYDTCLNDESKSQILFNHAKLIGSDKDFVGTPSFYINGELYQGEYTIKAISEFLEKELKEEVSHGR